MTTTLQIWIIDPTDSSKLPRKDTTPHYINIGTRDQMRKQALGHIERSNFKLRSLNHSIDGHLIAYVYPNHLKARTATKVAGWVYKRTSVPPIIE